MKRLERICFLAALLAAGLPGCADDTLDEAKNLELDVTIRDAALCFVPAPQLVAPADGATLTEARPLFSWRLLWGFDRVLVQICADPACSTVTQSFTSRAGTSARPAQDLTSGTYYWRAARIRGPHIVSAWSSIRRFVIQLAPVVTQDLFGVWSVTATDVWVVGAAGTILHYDGGWSAETSPTTQNLQAVWAQSGGQAWAVGAAGTIVRRNGSSWATVASPTSVDLWGVWGAGIDDAWAAGDAGIILHWNGISWSVSLDRAAGRFLGAWGRATDDVWVVGSGREPDTDYAALLLHWNGTGWTESYVCNPEGTRFASGGWVAFLADVWGLAGPGVWGAGGCGPGASFIPFGYVANDAGGGAGWGDAAPTIGSLADFRFLSAIWASSNSDVWAASASLSTTDGDPTMLHFDGTTWTASAQLITVGIEDLGGTSASDVWAVGKAGKRLHYDGTTWTATP